MDSLLQNRTENNIHILNNTIINKGIKTNNLFAYPDILNFNIYNNIFYGNDDNAIDLYYYTNWNMHGMYLNHNFNYFFGYENPFWSDNGEISLNEYEFYDINPQFIDADNFDYNLNHNSTCINGGHDDLDGDGISYKGPDGILGTADDDDDDKDPDGTRLDISAFYFHTIIGDINFDNEIGIIDIILLVDFILGINELTENQQYLADLNQDELITVSDVLELVNILLGNALPFSNSTITYLSGIIEVIEDGQRYKYNIDMLNEQDVYILYFELQFDNKSPLNVIKGTRSNDMTLTHVYKEENNTLNIMVYSPEGRKITPGFGTILEIELETTALGREGELTNGSEFVITDLANNPETLIPVEIVSADELSRLAEIQPSSLPTEYNLYSVYPNPFNPTTNITYELPEESFVSIVVYDLVGRKVDELVSGLVQSGRYNITWNADQFSSGVYFVTMTAPNFTTSQKVVLFK